MLYIMPGVLNKSITLHSGVKTWYNLIHNRILNEHEELFLTRALLSFCHFSEQIYGDYVPHRTDLHR